MFDLSLVWTTAPSRELVGRLSYRAELFDGTTAARWAAELETLLGAMASGAEERLSALPLLPAALRHQILREWPNPGDAAAGDLPTLPERFERWAVLRADAPAVHGEDGWVSYGPLNARANRLARWLAGRGVGPEVRVGLYLERSLDAVLALLAVHKAGGAYVPLDPAHPVARVRHALRDAGARLLLSRRPLLAGLGALAAEAVALEEIGEEVASLPAPNLRPPLPATLAYVIYTSGSTGGPKGVAVEHRQLASYLSAVGERLALPAGTSYALLSTLAADLGHTVLFSSLATGGCLHLIPEDAAQDGAALARWPEAPGIEVWKIVASQLRALLASGAPAAVLPRRCLVLGGEASSWELIDHLRELAPG